MLIILVLGGYGRLYGAFIGAVVYMALSHFLAKVYPTAWQLGLGLLLMLIALFARNGIIGLWDTLTSRFMTQGAGRHDRRAARNPLAQQELRRARRRRATSISGWRPARAMR